MKILSSHISAMKQYIKQHFPIILLLVCGFLLRVLFVIISNQVPASDAADYHVLAMNLHENGQYAYNEIPTAYRPIGFPLILSFAYSIYPSIIAGQIMQSILIVMSGWIIYLLIVRIIQNTRSALMGTALWLFLPITIGQSLLLLSEPLCTFCILSGMYLYLYKNHLIRYDILSGILFGLAILTRPTVLFPIVAFLLIVIYKNNNSFRSTLKAFIAVSIACICTIAPWLIRNNNELGKAVLATNGGINFWIGNNPQANGSYKMVEEPRELLQVTSELHRDSIAYALGWNYISQQPIKTIASIPKKIAFLWSSDMYMLLSLNNSINTPSSYKLKASSIEPILALIFLLPTLLLLIYGWYSLSMHASNGFIYISLLFIITWTLMHGIFFGSARYHEPLLPFFIIAIAIKYSSHNVQFSPIYLVLPLFQLMIFITEIFAIYIN